MSKERDTRSGEALGPTSPGQERDEQQVLSRRGFMRASVLGAGALALPDVASAALTQGPTPPGGGGQALCEEVWFEPSEWNVSEAGNDYLPLWVTEVTDIAQVLGRQPPTPAEKLLWPAFLFGYNDRIPGPTIRMGGDDVLRVHLVNKLSGNNGAYAGTNKLGHARFVKNTAVPTAPNSPRVPFKANVWTPLDTVPAPPTPADWLLSEALLYGAHQQHTTNLHTHGLHVSSQPNEDGSFSDNVLMRIIPQEDFENRLENDPSLPLKANEFRRDAKYEFRLGKSSGPHVETHPPGTHWYHPHPHGATYDQVASGMAGFLIVEGDVDDSLRGQIEGYKERLMLLQRVVGPAPIEGEGASVPSESKRTFTTVNGQPAGRLQMVMRPGAIERWRILNGSVDGQGYIRFVVVKGEPAAVLAPADQPTGERQEQYEADLATHAGYLEDPANQQWLDQLAFDGITLVNPQGDYDTLRLQSLVMAPANRADVLFQAPPLDGETTATYSLWAVWDGDATDSTTRRVNFKIASVCITGDPFDPGVTRRASGDPRGEKLELTLPPVPELIQPIADAELVISQAHADALDRPRDAGKWRTRRVIYAGWGGNSYPCDDSDFSFNSMTIDGRKFNDEFTAHKMGLGTAEQWTLDNYSMTIFTDASKTRHYGETVSHEVMLAGPVHSKAADHPFHMHQNPFLVHSVVDANGNELLPADESGRVWPRWQDVVRIPRNGGRVVFRSRFWDYIGKYVNHCHLLNHEDWGMMQTVAVVANPFDADYEPRAPGLPYEKASAAEMYHACVTIVTPGQPLEGEREFQFCDDEKLDPPPPPGS